MTPRETLELLIWAIAGIGMILLIILAVRAFALQQELSNKKHKTVTPGVSDLLPYAAEVDDGIIVLKSGAFCAAWLYKPDDPDYIGPETKELQTTYINNAVRDLGDGWMFHIDAVRRKAPDYPKPSESFFPDRVTRAIDEERRRLFTHEGTMFETYFVITVTWKPPVLAEQRLAELMFDDDKQKPSRTQRTEALIRDFKKRVQEVEARLGFVFRLERLRTHDLVDEDGSKVVYDDFLAWLQFCVTGENHPVQLPSAAMYLDRLIGGQDFWAGVTPRIGKNFIAAVSIEGFPSGTVPGILNVLATIDAQYRWSTRFICMDRSSAQAHIDRYRRLWKQKERGFFDQVFNRQTGRINQDAVSMVADADQMFAEVASQEVNAGYYTSVVIIMSPDREKLDKAAASVLKGIQKLGFSGRVETVNAIEAWLGSLPGNGIANVRRPLLTTANLGDLFPTAGIWTGDPHAPCPLYPPDSPALMHCVTAGCTPFRFNLHVGDVGHTAILGPTGSGKSTLLGLIAAQARRYAGMRIYAFDKGRSIKALCEACGGSYYEIGGEVRLKTDAADAATSRPVINFAPLLGVRSLTERDWAQDWIETLLRVNDLQVDPQMRMDIRTALDLFAKHEETVRDLTSFIAYLNNPKAKEVLQMYLRKTDDENDPSAILDASKDVIGESSFCCFELEELMNRGPKTVLPVLLYLFHKIENALHGEPTLIFLDEAWVVLGHPAFRDKVNEWLKTLRKKNCAVILATQSLNDLKQSGISDVINESCPTKVFLPNPTAMQPGTRELYESMGLNPHQIRIIQTAVKKRDYYCATPKGHRKFQLAIGPLALSIIGASTPQDIERIEALKRERGAAWVDAWLAERNLRLSDFGDGYAI